MLFSLAWLRSICPIDDDAPTVERLLTARGLTVDSVTAVGDDAVLDVDVPANRPDCLGHRGVARELSAATGVALIEAAPHPATEGEAVDAVIDVFVDDPRLCHRFTASLVRNAEIGPSPDWVVRRLEACGLRSINNVVDASNLVMLETGNPIHFYDLERVAGATLRVRRAEAGERLTTLDGVERQLRDDMLVIADGARASGIAGVMGGADSEIHGATRHVLIEAAWFDPASVRRTSNRLGLRTDASFRFERGVDPEGVVVAQGLAVRLLAELAGGRPAPGLIDVHPVLHVRTRLSLRLPQLPRLLGYDPGVDAAVDALRALSLAPERTGPDRIEVEVPSWRVDLVREVDLVEEVARHLGYERIPATTEGLPSRIASAPAEDLETPARQYLAAHGFNEAFGYSMIGVGEDEPFVEPDRPAAPRLANPISEAQAELRRSLIPGLLRAVDINRRRGVRDVRLFEVGPVFLVDRERKAPAEPVRIAMVWSGSARPRHWSEPGREASLFDVLGLVEGLLRRLRPGADLRRQHGVRPGLHPAHAACWRTGSGVLLASAGQLHPDVRSDLDVLPWIAEIDVDAVSRIPRMEVQFEPIPRLTEVTRDLAVVVRPGVEYAAIIDCFRGVESPAPATFEAVDRYEGPPLAEGESSLTVRVTIRPDETALTESEIERYRLALIEALGRELGLGIRGD